jgi:hypothetical protein
MDAESKRNAAVGPLVTLSVVSHGNGEALQILLESLVRHEAANRIQLIVTDNLGADLPDLDPSGWHSLVLLHNERPRGYASNHNAAFLHARGEYFCVVNPDVFFMEPALERLTQPLAAGSADIAAPVIVDSLGRIQDSFRKLPTPLELVWRRTLHGGHRVRVPPVGAVHPDWIAGIFLLMRCETFARLGGFDARYHLYFEDVDFCTRARLLGMTLLVTPLVRLHHDASRASGRYGLYLLWHLQSAYRFFISGVYRQARSMRNRPAAL